MTDVVFETERLILRPFIDADVPLYAAINRDPEVMRYLGARPLALEETVRQIEGANASWAFRQFGKLAVVRKADGAFLGMCGLSVEDWYPDDLEIGWRLAPRYWGQGYASEAARPWLAHAFETLAVPRVISLADVPNLRSVAVMQRIGMHWDHDAELDDDGERFWATIFVMTAAQYQSMR